MGDRVTDRIIHRSAAGGSAARRPPEGDAPTGAPATLADAVPTLDGNGRVAAVAVDPDWTLAHATRAWDGPTLPDLFDGRGARIAVQACRMAETRPIDVVAARDGGPVPLSVVIRAEDGVVHLHLRDRRPEAALQAQLSRMLAALESDRSAERGLDGRHRALLAGMVAVVAVVDTASGRIVALTGAAAGLPGGTAPGLVGAAFTQSF